MRQILLSALILFANTGYAQQTHHLNGTVVDSLSAGISGAVVSCSAQDNMLAATTTDADGKFSLALQADTVNLQISSLAYKTYELQLNLTGDVDLGTIVLHESAQHLAAVSVTAEFIKRRGTALEVSVRHNPAALNKNTLQFLNTLPCVNGLNINGREDALVYVNGRELLLPPDEKLRYLAGLRAEYVESISILPTGGAKYRADNKGGIIRLKLRRNDDHLFSGSVTLPVSFNTYDGAFSTDVPLSLNYTTKRLSMYTYLAGNYLQNEVERQNYRIDRERERLLSSHTFYTFTLDQSFLYDVAKNQTLGLALNTMLKPREHTATDTKSAENLLMSAVADNVSLYRGGGTLTYEWTIDDKGSNLFVSGDYLYRRDGDNSNYTSATGNNERTLSRTDKNTFSVSADSEVHFADDVSTLNVGAQYMQLYARQRYTQDNQYNRFAYDEATGSAYAEFDTSFADDMFDLSAGLRFEATAVQWRNDDVDTPLRHKTDNYWNLFPSLSFTYNSHSGKSYTSLEYERSIQRPLMADYNPVLSREGENVYSIGASSLVLPQFENVISLTQGINDNHIFVLSYIIDKNLYDTVYRTDADNNLYETSGNFGSSHKLDLYAQTRFWIVKNRLQMRLSASGTYTRFIHADAGHLDTFDAMADAGLTLILPKSWQLSVSGHYLTPTTTPIQRTSDVWGVNMGVSKTVGKHLILSLSGVNLLYNKHVTTTSRQTGVDFSSYARNYFQHVTFSVTYNFGSSKLQYVKQAKTNYKLRERSGIN